MTICVLVKVHDCLVFAADSASSLIGEQNGQPAIVKVFRHGNKVFNLYKCLPIVAMTCGMGNLGDASIGTLAKDLRTEFKKDGSAYFLDRDKYTMEDVANKAHEFFFVEKYSKLNQKPKGDHSFEFWVGGYGADSSQSEVWRIHIVNGNCSGPEKVHGATDIGMSASGQPDAFNQLALGFGTKMADALVAVGVDKNQVPQVLQAVRKHTKAPMLYPSMPVQDAIRLADFMVETTKGFVSFIPGADVVGGDTDIAVVTKHEGFKWIRRKHYYSVALNPLETDHV